MDSFLIVGAGRFGSSLATELTALGHEVLLIDRSEEKIAPLADYVTHVMICDARDEKVISSLGVRNFNVAVVAMAEDIESSVLITIMLKEMGIARVVAKAQSLLHKKVLERVGADEIVFPERDMGKRLAKQLSSTNIIDFIELSEEHSIVELEAPRAWHDKSLAELNIRNKHGVNIIAVRSASGRDLTISPAAAYIIREGDILVVLGDNGDIKKLKGE